MFIKINLCYNKDRTHGEKLHCSSWVGDGHIVLHEYSLDSQSVRVLGSEWHGLIYSRSDDVTIFPTLRQSFPSFLLSALLPSFFPSQEK